MESKLILGDCIEGMKLIANDSAQIVICDPPYNIGKDFGNSSDKQPMDEYLVWCDKWISECLRILKPNGTMFVYGFSEILALILSRVPMTVNRRWLVWHYTNKNVPSLKFWQRSHESILCLWKNDKVFNLDDVREPYTDTFLKNAAGKTRKATKGRYGSTETTYNAHEKGALPRDVIKFPALAGGAGVKERTAHPTQKPLRICDHLIRSCKQSDGYVLVPFAGSGSEIISAINHKLPYIGFEINSDYIEIVKTRITELDKVPDVVPEQVPEVVEEKSIVPEEDINNIPVPEQVPEQVLEQVPEQVPIKPKRGRKKKL